MKTQKRRKAVKDYLKHLESSDLLQAVHRARHKATERLYDQGVTALALLLSETLTEALEQPDRLSQRLIRPSR
ncbi:hypothetical protein LM602_07745 [Candidatus Acetothermia bacterium]|jgi:hypothetical protein|nr:hypothetical protein [Candidatus Acetothermia bacterium]MCI2432426.1 hypothetical protein [Candidatus Acetothermia bacterium]MCI2436317.1 hypothetical protein [Candidatus Acetothermia bacterium]